MRGMPAPRTPRRTILITGASSGLGAGMARAWAARGRDLALCARRVDRLEALRDELLAAHPGTRVVVHPLDVTDGDQVAAVVHRAEADLGSLDRVVVNAGVGGGRPVGTGGAAANRAVVETNATAALAQCEAALEVFRRRGTGHLVVVSSFAAFRGLGGSATAYAASKAFVAVLAEGIRVDTHGTGIAVTTVHPGYVASEMTAGSRPPFLVDTATGVRAILRAVEAERAEAVVPAWPWVPLRPVFAHLPRAVLRRLG